MIQFLLMLLGFTSLNNNSSTVAMSMPSKNIEKITTTDNGGPITGNTGQTPPPFLPTH